MFDLCNDIFYFLVLKGGRGGDWLDYGRLEGIRVNFLEDEDLLFAVMDQGQRGDVTAHQGLSL